MMIETSIMACIDFTIVDIRKKERYFHSAIYLIFHAKMLSSHNYYCRCSRLPKIGLFLRGICYKRLDRCCPTLPEVRNVPLIKLK